MMDPDKQAEHPTVFDTDQQYIGSVYAKSLLGVAGSEKIDQVLGELNSFTDAVGELPALKAILESPRIAFAEKEPMLDKVLADTSTEFKNFVKVLTRKQRFECLAAVRNSANSLFNEMAGRIDAVLTTAEPVGDEVKGRIAKRLADVLGKEVALATAVDADIIGGMVVRVGDTVYDASVKNQLKQVRDKAMQRATSEIRKALDRFAIDA